MAENHLSFPSLHIFGVFPLVFLSIQCIFTKWQHAIQITNNLLRLKSLNKLIKQIGSLPFSFSLAQQCNLYKSTNQQYKFQKIIGFSFVRLYFAEWQMSMQQKCNSKKKKFGKPAKEKSINEKCFSVQSVIVAYNKFMQTETIFSFSCQPSLM